MVKDTKRDEDEIKRLYRSKKDRVIAGVCAGIGDYAKMDPVVIRVIFVLATLVTGVAPGILIYLLMWAIIPEK